ncbi:hypothetical protein E4T48_00796 [Aureobasidium sp. EXF-10727]|nr:hypothetical protein E4T48_00796 [Aureobasidium sp. EXF-10727]KAI4731952.1 hypothetical protein E4T49_00021 [Aureobasidium sp. EXF-10728]
MSSTAVLKPSPAASRFVAPTTPLRPSSAPSTPQKSQAHQVPPPTKVDTPGTWRHPNMDAINRRKDASTFTSDNLHAITVNAVALLVLLLGPTMLSDYTPTAVTAALQSMQPYATWASLLVRCIPVINISLALMPLFRPVDEMTDIPLTREQRQLLGLTPQNVPLPAGSPGYVTPPRYSRSSTPRSSAQKHTSASPMSHKASPSSFDQSTLGVSKGVSGSPFSVSPLMQKAVGGASAARTSSPLDNSLGSSSSGLATGKATVSLNSKWLYERGKGSPNAGRPVFS